MLNYNSYSNTNSYTTILILCILGGISWCKTTKSKPRAKKSNWAYETVGPAVFDVPNAVDIGRPKKTYKRSECSDEEFDDESIQSFHEDSDSSSSHNSDYSTSDSDDEKSYFDGSSDCSNISGSVASTSSLAVNVLLFKYPTVSNIYLLLFF